jgi:hypothetical protein
MNEFRNSTIEELYGPSKLTEPPVVGQINWKQVAVYSAIAIVIVGVPIICVSSITKKRNEVILERMEKRHEEDIASLRKEQQQRNGAIVTEVFEKVITSLNNEKQL